MPVERRGLTGRMLQTKRGEPLEYKILNYGKYPSPQRGRSCAKRPSRSGDCASLRRELSGEPDAGKPQVRFDEGGIGHKAWHAAIKPRKGKPRHGRMLKPKQCSLFLYSTGERFSCFLCKRLTFKILNQIVKVLYFSTYNFFKLRNTRADLARN